MGDEGHIAGTSDNVPHKFFDNTLKRALTNASVRELSSRRHAVVSTLRAERIALRVINGGGSGSLVSTFKDESITEATIGSGLYASGLFHHFKEIQYQPAAFFALQVVRKPKDGMVTCAGGGYIASGAIEKSKLPLPVMPVGLKYVDLEGAGEVQTPLVLAEGTPALELGDPIFCHLALIGVPVSYLTGGVVSTGPITAPVFLATWLVKGAFLSSEAASSLIVYMAKAAVFRNFGALPAVIIAKGRIFGSTLMAGAFIAKRFVLKMDAAHFRLLMDGLMLASGLVLLAAAFF